MVITCGNTYETVLHGAFVESVFPRSPVDLDGTIRPGDQIISVNSINVENDYFLTVVDLIQCSNSPIELVVAKTAQFLTNDADFSMKEIVEIPFTKSKSWLVGGEEKSDCSKKSEGTSPISEMPVPKPRKKLIQRKLSEQPLDVPDLTINHSKIIGSKKSPEKDPVCGDYSIRNNWSIPDIIASQVKQLDSSSECDHLSKCETSEMDLSSSTALNENVLLPGEVFHVVLDKKGGSLGLNIYQGTETGLQKHIYIHSVIPDGAAESDGRIQPGDKLLEVNSVPLEYLSYQEVVTTLRGSPQVAHLVLEKGNGYSQRDSNTSSTPVLVRSKKELLKSNSDTHFDFPSVSHDSAYTTEYDQKIETVESPKSSYVCEENTFSSLPTSFEHSPSSAKELSSASSLHLCEDYTNHNGHPSVDDLDIIGSQKLNGSLKSSPSYSKDSFQNRLTSYKSTPNLVDSSDEEDARNGCKLYRNRSSECLLNSPLFLNPHQALIDIYQNYSYIRGSSCNIHQIPAVPIRKKKLKKLQDVYKYCNDENTFTVTISKTSRGLGLAIQGGKDISRKDFFSQLIRIRKLYPLQPALECGKLRLGDVILEVNETIMVGLTNTEALEVLRCASQDVVLKVFRPSKSLIPTFSVFKGAIWPGFNSSSSSASSSLSRTENNTYNVETGEFEVTLMKRDGSLGFTISRKDTFSISPKGIYVKALVREHAVSDGRIQPGDRILKVNGVDVSSFSHAEAINCLRNTPDKVTLKLFRDDPPLTPGCLEDDYTITKPLRWEAVELLNDRVKQKDSSDDSNTLKRKIKRKLDRAFNGPSNSSSNSTCSSSSSGQEYIADEKEIMSNLEEELAGVGLHRSQRPRSMDVLNSSDRKRFIGHSEEDSLHRQSSVMCTNNDKNENSESNNVSIIGGKNLLKWRGQTLNESQELSAMDTIQENVVSSSKNLSFGKQCNTTAAEEGGDDFKPVPYPRTTSFKNEWVNTLDVSIDRGWHSRLGFSLCDPPDVSNDPSRDVALPMAAEVKAVHLGSLAEKDGRVKVGDRLVEVNGESLLGKAAHEVIDILRKTRGVTRMVFCRLEKRS